jgi:N-acetylglucosaminyldiphosphoundecaprenol N-acetyl-beta-D-mannosaminyltransferase
MNNGVIIKKTKYENPIVEIFGYQVFSGDIDFFSGELIGVINTISPHSFILANSDKLFHDALKNSDIIIPDGIGIVIATRVLTGKKIIKIAGFDLHEILIKSLNAKKGSCFYLGASEDTLLKINKQLSVKQPSIRVGSLSPAFKDHFNTEENTRMINEVNRFNPDVLFVGMTAPKQEKWVYDNRHLINAPIICSIGAVFDFYAETIKRPGKFWISIGLEWLPRLIREPKRLYRRTLISTPLFILYVIIEKLRIMLKKSIF